MRAIVTWMIGAMLLLSGLYCEAAEPSASLETLVRRGLEASSAPPEDLMLAGDAAEEVLRQMGPDGRQATTAHLRLLMWLGDRRAIPPLAALVQRKAVDRYAAVRALAALDAPGAEQLALELFEDDPAWGAPLLASFHGAHGSPIARQLLAADDSRHWLPAIWVLANSRDYNQMSELEDRLRSFDPKHDKTRRAIGIALRRLRIEQRDIRTEALGEYLEEVRDGSLDERLWCLTELGYCRQAGAVKGLKNAPWLERSRQADSEAATILWARHYGGDPLSAAELHHLRLHRYHLTWIPGGTHWPPVIHAD